MAYSELVERASGIPGIGDRVRNAEMMARTGQIEQSASGKWWQYTPSGYKSAVYRFDLEDCKCQCNDEAPRAKGKKMCEHVLAAFFVRESRRESMQKIGDLLRDVRSRTEGERSRRFKLRVIQIYDASYITVKAVFVEAEGRWKDIDEYVKIELSDLYKVMGEIGVDIFSRSDKSAGYDHILNMVVLEDPNGEPINSVLVEKPHSAALVEKATERRLRVMFDKEMERNSMERNLA